MAGFDRADGLVEAVFAHTLGDAVKRARGVQKLTQSEVATMAGIDVRTVLNIENYKGNPKFEALCSLIRTLQLDTQEIFYPELAKETASLVRIKQIVSECSEEELETLIPVVTAVLSALRDKDAQILR